MHKFVRALLDFLFPQKCLVCKEEKPEPLCSDCVSRIRYISPPFCKICGKPEDKYFVGELCRDCAPARKPFHRARSLGMYEGALKTAIHKLKFKRKRSLGPIFGKLIIDYLKEIDIDLSEVDLIHSVPLSERRMKSRGYNQVDLFSEAVSTYFKIPLEREVLVRKKETKQQFDLPRELRFKNVRGAFKIKDANKIKDKTILLLDDIYTTGSTVFECSKALREAGAKKVYVLTLSRALD